MKKLIALFATTAVASGSAMGAVALSGTASVSYDDNGSAASETSYDADLAIVGTAGSTTLTAGYDMEGSSLSTTGVSLATTIGPATITADMHDATETLGEAGDNVTGELGNGNYKYAQDDTGVSVSLNAPIGDATVGLDNSGNVSVSGTFSGVTVAHTIKNGADTTTGSASIAGMDISVTNDAGDTSWTIGTTVSGVALTLNSDNDVTAAFGLTGNTMTISHYGAAASKSATAIQANGVYASDAKYSTAAAAAYTTVAISRSLTSGATLSATYKDSDDSLTLKAAVAF